MSTQTPGNVDNAVGERLRRARVRCGFSQDDVAAEGLGFGLTQTTISRIERGIQGARLDQLFVLAEYYNVRPSSIVRHVEGTLGW